MLTLKVCNENFGRLYATFTHEGDVPPEDQQAILVAIGDGHNARLEWNDTCTSREIIVATTETDPFKLHERIMRLVSIFLGTMDELLASLSSEFDEQVAQLLTAGAH